MLVFVALACFAGALDTMAGGGGLITVPGQILMGVPPISALVNNKCSAFAGTVTATWRLYRKGLLKPKELMVPVVASFTASLLGAFVLTFADPSFVGFILPWVLLAIAGYFALAQSLNLPRFNAAPWMLTVAIFVVGFYDGFMGPGTGSLMLAAVVLLSLRTMRDATVFVKACNGASNVAALLVFAPSDWVIWPIALALLVGQVLGGYLGAYLVERHAETWARPLVVVVSLLMAGRLLWT